MRFTLALLMLALAGSPARSEEQTEKDHTFFALPILFYSTDTEFGYGAAGLLGYRSAPERTSQLVFAVTHTTKHQLQAAMKNEHYFADGRHRFLGEIGYSRFPSEFFGFGNNTSNDDPETYTPEYVEAEFSLARRTFRDLWIRGGGFFRNQALVDRGTGSAIQNPFVPWGTGRMDAGLTAGVLWDSRDNTMASNRGSLFLLKYYHTVYQDRGDGFRALSLDIRAFRSPRPGWIFGSQFRAEGIRGDAPFYYLPDLGGQEFLRGYEDNRFVDRNLILFQQDLRFPIWWRIGGCVFVSAGRVAHEGGELLEGKYHAGYGAGLRYFINRKDGMVIRLDMAGGNDSGGTYISFGEAF